MRYMITDEIWAVMGPLVEAHTSPHASTTKLPERMFFEALLYIARTGSRGGTCPAISASGPPCTTGSGAGSGRAASDDSSSP